MSDDNKLTIVALGASAGGLEPIKRFIQHIDTFDDVSFVIIQHSNPNQETRLVDILSPLTTSKVKLIEKDEQIVSGQIYICPTNYNLEIFENRFKLLQPLKETHPTPSIDTFFISLAKEKAEKSIGIIFSGVGNDGTEGIKALKKVGAITIAQDEKTAKYPGMPRSAIDTKGIDIVLAPEDIAAELSLIISQHITEYKEEDFNDEISEIYDILLDRTGTDFSDYKLSTIFRRIKRRMIFCKKQTINEYIKYLNTNEEEVILLHKELLVIVTSFFRDSDAFNALEKNIEKIILSKHRDEPIRIWVTGCATGEEAYSIAIAFYNLLKKNKQRNKIQIFATDISVEAIEKARSGTYTSSEIKNVNPKLIKSYFVKNGNIYKVSKEIRDIIIFSKHDLIKDPPFLNMDLITCRNLLIYFNSALQKRIFSIFFNVLNKNGYLFLGKSESTTNLTKLFTIIDNKWKFFKKDITAKPPAIESMTYFPKRYSNDILPTNKQINKNNTDTYDLKDYLAQTVLEKYIETYIIINKENHIVYIKGDVEEYTKIPKGGFTIEIFSFLKESIRIDVRVTVLKARKEQKVISIKTKLNEKEYLQVEAIPIINSKIHTEGVCIVFKKYMEHIDIKDELKIEEYNKINIQELEQELIETKDRLQTAIEELETSNEELQSTNEELQSSNEELQSTNEELETSNEELQSTNEELTTVNQELEEKSEDLRVVYKDLENTFNIIDYGIVMLDKDLKVRKYTSYMEKISTMTYSIINHSINYVHLPIDMKLFIEKIKNVMDTSKDHVFESEHDNKYFWITIKPYFAEENSVKGSIISFIDITKLKINEIALENAKVDLENINENLEKLVDDKTSEIKVINRELENKNKDLKDTLSLFENTFEQAAVGIAHVAIDGKWLRVNSKLLEIVGYTKEELLTKTFQDVTYEDDLNLDLEYMNKMLAGEIKNYSMHKRYIKKDGSIIWINLTGSLVYDSKQKPDYFIAVVEDIDKQKKQEELIKKQKKEFESIFINSKDGIAILDLESKFLKFNKAYMEMTGFNKKELLTKNCIDLTAPESLDKTREAFEIVLENGFYDNLEKNCIVKDGRRVTVIMTLTLMPDKRNILLTTKDITSFKVMEAQTKLASMGEMIGNIAHQWRQPLSVITTCASGLKLKSEVDGDIDKKLLSEFSSMIMDQSDYLSNTIDDFKNFIKNESQFMQIKVSDIIEHTLKIANASIKSNHITLIRNTNDDITVNGSLNELEQALINILNNAKDALNDKLSYDEDKYIFLSTTKIDENTLELKVCDNAGGIKESIKERIFEPYFTTKHQSVGTGLGLSMTHKIVKERHNQTIEAYNDETEYNGKIHKGACFKITFKGN